MKVQYVLFNYGGELPKGFGKSAGKSASPKKSVQSKKSVSRRGSYSAPARGPRGGFSQGLKFGTASQAYNPFGGSDTGKYASSSQDLSKGVRGQLRDMSKAELLKLVGSIR